MKWIPKEIKIDFIASTEPDHTVDFEIDQQICRICKNDSFKIGERSYEEYLVCTKCGTLYVFDIG